ncbi:hypothetical protein ABH917_001202 [Thermobifida halotolerans]
MRTNRARSPSSSTSVRPGSSWTSAITTCAPAAAKSRVSAAPMPCPPPVMTAARSMSRWSAVSAVFVMVCGP